MRLFVAVWPPASVVADLAALPRPVHASVRWTTNDQWHVTLRFLGSVDSADGVVSALTAALAGFGAIDVELGPATRRLGAGVLCVPVSRLEPLAAAVVQATASIGAAPDPRPFTGHLTLARSRRRSALPKGLSGTPVTGAWTVDSVAVVESHLGGAGARYETVATVPLT